jgi:hypothetical protein
MNTFFGFLFIHIDELLQNMVTFCRQYIEFKSEIFQLILWDFNVDNIVENRTIIGY